MYIIQHCPFCRTVMRPEWSNEQGGFYRCPACDYRLALYGDPFENIEIGSLAFAETGPPTQEL